MKQKDEKKEKEDGKQGSEARPRDSATDAELRTELVEYLQQNREDLREEWVRRITDGELLGVMSREEIFSEAGAVYDNYVDALKTGSTETLEAYARDLSERIIERGVETDEVLSIVLLLRDVLGRALFANYGQDAESLNQVLDAYEPAANRIMVTVGVSFVEERERVIRQQQEAIRKLSTPVMKIRERLLLLPIIGALDKKRMEQLTAQLLEAIRAQRAQVLVVDITGVAEVDRAVANHLVKTVEAASLMGTETIMTGLSSEIAQTLVDLEVDLARMKTVGDLQGGLEEAEWLLRQRRVEPETGHLDGFKPVGPETAGSSRSATKGTVPEPHSSPKAPEDRSWDWHGTAEADKGDAILEHGGWAAFARAHAWYDPSADQEGNDPPHEKQAYKLPHHELIDGDLRVVWSGVRSAMQVLAGARVGVDIPDADRNEVYRHLEQHYREFDKEPPDFSELGS